jgi:ligand-binding SRPBCC domain-containing protein
VVQKKLKMHRITTVQRLPISLERAWDFFSSPKNLSLITPEALNLVPTCEVPERMYPGMIVTYNVRPVAGIPMEWVTEITHVRDKEFFVDEQRSGPYRIWHHQHHFRAVEGGVEMTDIVDYKIPFGIFGKVLERLFIGKQVAGIFEFRRKRLIEMFGS